jgi:hypothetical protein
VDLAIEILKAILTETSSMSPSGDLDRHGANKIEEIRKAYISFLSKLTLAEPEEVEEWKVKAIQALIIAIPEVGYFLQYLQELIFRNAQFRMLPPRIPWVDSSWLFKNDSQIN